MSTKRNHKPLLLIYLASGRPANRWHAFGIVALIVFVEVLKWLLH